MAKNSVKFFTFFASFLIAQNSFALPSFKQSKSQGSATVLKADQVEGDKVENVLVAKGNAEVTKDNSVIYADRMTYSKNKKTIRAIGNVKVKNLEIGNMWATEGEIADDFSSGKFIHSKIIFLDGSYLTSPEIDRESATTTTLYNSIYALCPDDDIAQDNSLAGKKFDMATISSSKNTIDREKGMMKIKHGVFKLYHIPIFYTPYMKVPLPSKNRESGFLAPIYAKNSNFGVSIKLPYYFNIAPNMDLITAPQISLTSNQILVSNQFRHLTDYGRYELGLDVANNELKDTRINPAALDANSTALLNKTDKDIRWALTGKGLFDFTQNTGLDFDIRTISDPNYLRDYRFYYIAYTESKAKLDYIKGRDYYAVKTIRFQELQDHKNADQAPFVLPEITTYNESKKSLFFKEKYALTSNITSINPTEGIQYRRATVIPEIRAPFNLKGNLFEIGAKAQGDFYWIENNFRTMERTNDYQSIQTNYKPEISASWKLPLIQKTKFNTLIFEPMVMAVSSSYKRNFNQVVNADSNNSELTVSNLFVTDRIYGYDRNESGERVSYGFKSSLFNKFGEFGLTLGQSYRISDQTQDVTISGFANNNKSNFVGQALYKARKYFAIYYNFQLNESSYRNDINQVVVNIDLNRIKLNTDYILLRRTPQNPEEREQMTITADAQLTERWHLKLSTSEDLKQSRTLLRTIILNREGCCTVFGISVTETNPSALVKPQRSISFSLVFKNL